MEAKGGKQALLCEDDFDVGGGRKIERNEEEDDCVTFVGSPSHPCVAESKSNTQVFHLNTNLARVSISQGAEEGKVTGSQRQNAPVTVVFDLPDGSQADQEFQLGQTVEVLKSFVESEFGIPMACQELYLGSVLMMDPMSLLDYPEFDGRGEVLIVVEGDMSEESKK